MLLKLLPLGEIRNALCTLTLTLTALLGLAQVSQAALPSPTPNDSDRTNLSRAYHFTRHTNFRVPRQYPASNLHDTPIDHYPFDVTAMRDTVHIPLVDAEGNPRFVFPIKSAKTSGFGPRGYRFHFGTDLRLSIGDTVAAAMDGIVRIVREDKGGYGYFIVLAHPNGLETLYGHLSRQLVREGQRIKAGETIGLGGNTGFSTGPHLHFEILFMGEQFNPEYVMNIADTALATRELAITCDYFRHLKRHQHRGARYTPYTPPALDPAVPAQLASQPQVYVVRSGDTLGHIARRYGTTVTRLCKLNALRPTSVLQIGQKIKVG